MLPFAYKNGEIVFIDEVENGLACGCICPACKRPIIAKKGNKKIHHFAHSRGVACSSGVETMLHLYTKHLLSEYKYIVTPAVEVPYREMPLFPAMNVQFRKVKIESRIGKFRPDLCIVIMGQKRLFIEVRVTHGCTAEKINFFKKNRMAVIEINLQKFRNHPDLKELKDAILNQTNNKLWLNNPKAQLLHKRLKQNSIVKNVKHRFNGRWHYYTVSSCPLKRRKWREKGRWASFYADAFQDCLHCAFCIDIRYNNGQLNNLGPEKPKTVICIGHLDIESEIKKTL